MTSDQNSRRLSLYITGEHECAYLPDRTARTVFVDPSFPLKNGHYSTLIRQGMRRSGRYVYHPGCPHCDACQSLRVPVSEFQPRRRQRRCWQRNADLQSIVRSAAFHQEHFDLYRRYLTARHPGGGMDAHDETGYTDFLMSPWAETRFVEFRLDGDLVAVTVIDLVADGFSAVYTFFDPLEARRGLGSYAILWQIDAARRYGLDYVYLGYWIAECDKMRYKADYQPCEVYRSGAWERLIPPGAPSGHGGPSESRS